MFRHLTSSYLALMLSSFSMGGFAQTQTAPMLDKHSTDSEQTAPQIEASEDRTAYLDSLKQLYLTKDDRQALVHHLNSLLSTYALRAEYQVGQSERISQTYSVNTNEQAELIIRLTKQSAATQKTEVSNRTISVFGINPYAQSRCDKALKKCQFFLPESNQSLLNTIRDYQGAEEITKALTYLIKDLQKG